MKFDTFLATINDWGHYQRIKFAFICLTYMVPPIMVYTWSFTAATPDFRCHNPLFETDIYSPTTNELFNRLHQPTATECSTHKKLISVKECQRCFKTIERRNNSIDSRLQSCESYVFDRSIYKATLVEEWTMVCDRMAYRSTVQMIYFIGFMVGAIFFGTLSDKYGRRPIMSACFLLMTFSGFLCTFGPQAKFGVRTSYIIFSIGRFLLACSTRGISESGFVLVSELVGPKKRLMASVIMNYFFTFGEFLLVFFAYFIRTWRTLTLAISIFTIPFCFFYFILPESPRWLVSKGYFDEGEKILRRMAAKNQRNFDGDAFEQVKAEQEQLMAGKAAQTSMSSLFRTKVMRFVSINLFFQWLAQNLVYYGVSQNTNSWQLDPYLSFAIGAVVELIAYFSVHLILNRLGRKLPYCGFAVLFGLIALLVLPVQSFMGQSKSAQRAVMFAINVALKFLASASFAIIYLFSTELFPTNARSTGMGTCSMIGRLGAILGTFSNDYFTRIWINFPILVYGAVSLVAAVLALMLPETLNKPLPQTVEDVERMGLTFGIRYKDDSDLSVMNELATEALTTGEQLGQRDNIS